MKYIDNLTPELAHAWHPVALSSEVSDKPLAVKLLGEQWVLVRNSNGLIALRDHCPHRQAPLSAGCLVRDSLECPYHGWRFDNDGRCVHIPAMGKVTPPQSAAARKPAGLQEQYGMVWLAPLTPKAPLIDIPEWSAEDFRAGLMPPIRTSSSAAQVVDNFLDVTHFFFLHGKTFGLDAPDPISFYRVDRSESEVVLHHRTMFSNGSGPLMVRMGSYHCTLPYQCRLVAKFPGSDRVDIIALIAQPEDEKTTRIYKLMAYNWASEEQLAQMIDFETRVIGEDVAMSERLPTPKLPLATHGQSHARGDEIGLAWRHAIDDLFSIPDMQDAQDAQDAQPGTTPQDSTQSTASAATQNTPQDFTQIQQPTDADTDAPELLILWASQTGQSESLAWELSEQLALQGLQATCQPMSQWNPARLCVVRQAVFITSTFGDGEPPDNGRAFWQSLANSGIPRLDSLRYTVLAIGDRSFGSFCRHGQRLDERLLTLGAQPLATRHELEYGQRKELELWMQGIVTRITTPEASSAAQGTNVTDKAQDSSTSAKTAPLSTVRLIHKQIIGQACEDRVLLHCIVDLEGTGLTYEAGDWLRILPENSPAEVETLLEAAALDGDDPVVINGESMTLRQALRAHLDLRHGSTDVLQRVQPGSAAQAFADRLSPLQARQYSIASSPRVDHGKAHLLVACHPNGNGVCTSYLFNAAPDSLLRVSVLANPRFRLPEDDRPIILIGAGSGLAPLRSFLHERRLRQASGKSWLLFGERHAATDFHFQSEFEQLRSDGYLARIDTTFSRGNKPERYAQHSLKAQAELAWQWLQEGAAIYVCGSAQRLAQGVDETLRDIATQQGGLSADEASRFIARLRREGRYQQDVY